MGLGMVGAGDPATGIETESSTTGMETSADEEGKASSHVWGAGMETSAEKEGKTSSHRWGAGTGVEVMASRAGDTEEGREE